MNGRSTVATGVVVACVALGTAIPVEAAPAVRIHDIQGPGGLSPLVDQQVSEVTGVVTGVRGTGSARGFWLQDPEPDEDSRTSEGIFVYTGRQTPQLTPGQTVAVSATVAEHREVAEGETPETTPNQSVTELVNATWRVTGLAPVPEPEVLRPDTVPRNYVRDAHGGSIERDLLRPEAFALDFFESREGMNVEVRDARVIGPTDSYQGLWVTTKPSQNANARGGSTLVDEAAPNSGRLKISGLAEDEVPAADVGDRLRGSTTGPLDYEPFGGYVLRARAMGAHQRGDAAREVTTPSTPEEVSVATYNVENLGGDAEQAKFDRLARGIAENLRGPDVVALEEVQDDSGAADDGVRTANHTLTRLTEAIVAAGGPRYQWRQIDPLDGADGGQPGGNIRVAFLFDPTRLSAVDLPDVDLPDGDLPDGDAPGGDATTPVRVLPGPWGARLSVSPGRIEPTDPAWEDSRKPLVQQFDFRGMPVFVVANHFASKGGDQPLHGRFQPPARVSEQQRLAQARLVRGFADHLHAVDPHARLVVLGDLNDFGFSRPVRELTSTGLSSAADTLPEVERYSYVHEGNSQQLDHTLVSDTVVPVDYDLVHLNAEFADQASDHDPQVLRARLRWRP